MPTQRKKLHHYIHSAYIEAWRKPKTIYVYNTQQKKAYPKSGRDAGGETGFNVFSFDQKVVDLVLNTFGQRSGSEGNDVYRLIAEFVGFMRDFSYPNKADNWLEDFYGFFEARIGEALLRARRGERLIVQNDSRAFDSLVYFFCLQLFRTPRVRRRVSDRMGSIEFGDVMLSDHQKKEYIRIRLVADALAMAADLLVKGCRIRLWDVHGQIELATCDAPVVVNHRVFRKLEELEGWVPLNPSLLMEIDQIGAGIKSETRQSIGEAEAHQRNLRLILNAEKEVLFSSGSQRAKYLDQMTA